MVKRTYTFTGDGETIAVEVTPRAVKAFQLVSGNVREIKRFRVMDRQGRHDMEVRDLTPRLTYKIQILEPKPRNINVELRRIV